MIRNETRVRCQIMQQLEFQTHVMRKNGQIVCWYSVESLMILLLSITMLSCKSNLFGYNKLSVCYKLQHGWDYFAFILELYECNILIELFHYWEILKRWNITWGQSMVFANDKKCNKAYFSVSDIAFAMAAVSNTWPFRGSNTARKHKERGYNELIWPFIFYK